MMTWRRMLPLLVGLAACSGGEPPGMTSPDAGESGAVAGDHVQRCATACEDPGTEAACQPADSAACAGYCEEILDGFSDACGACIVREGRSIVELGGACLWGGEYDPGFDACAADCSHNRDPVAPGALLAKCEAFCVPCTARGGPQPCVAQARTDCIQECQDRHRDLPSACVACILGSSVRPETSAASGLCRAPFWTDISSCSAYCE